ncbi:MAG: hypothetical protein NT178_08320 [Proteobacteria bacterium]|nr:hypothetical protein [Pseudomonadota bacterium]
MNFKIDFYNQYTFWCLAIIAVALLYWTCVFIERIFYNNKAKKWRNAYPTLEEYLSIYPYCKTDMGVKCFNCDSFQRRFFWWDRSGKGRRVFYCQHCGKHLYRGEG